MRKTQFSRLISSLVIKGTLTLCMLALLAVGVSPKTILPLPLAQAVSSPLIDIPYVCTEQGPSSLSAAAIEDRIWKNRKVLRVRFVGGSEFLREHVRDYSSIWSNYANIRFAFVETGPSDIRISFTHDGSSWSYIGNSAESVDKNKPTMNFGWLDENTSEDIFRRTILHEFGHALGLIHEHQSPRAAIHWNRAAVYEYYDKRFDWNENVVNDNIFRKYERTRTQYTSYDPDSIMHYPIPAKFTTNGFSVGLNADLSKMDKAFISKMYP